MADKRRRKSLGLFRPRTDGTASASASNPTSPIDIVGSEDALEDEKSGLPRPRTLQKSHNKASVFGSLRSIHSLIDDDEKLHKTESKASSFYEDDAINLKDLAGDAVLHFGEVQSTNTVFRKRTSYLVLTEKFLIRFKSQAKAVEVFPSLPVPLKRSSTIRGSTTSLGSYHDMQLAANSDIASGVRLDQIVAAYKLDDGRPFFTVEVSYLDERSNRASSVQMQLNDPKEAELWLVAIQSAARNARAKCDQSLLGHTLDYISGYLDRHFDYDPLHFRAFKVIQRATHRSTGRTSFEDLSKLNSLVCYLAVGINKVHLIALARTSGRSSSTSLVDLDNPPSFGLVTLSSISLQPGEDSLQLVFKEPSRSPFALHIASSEASDIALCLRSAAEYLRPQWIRQPIMMNVPDDMDDQISPPEWPMEDHDAFERTLIAYCAAFRADTSRIYYTVEYECEDSPCFRLLPNTEKPYSAMELLAVFRALRYNESFASISFAPVDLTALRYFYDQYDSDPDSLCTRSGTLLNLEGHHSLSVLSQEVRALALKSKRLRRLNFSHTLPPSAKSEAAQQSCGIPEALVPLCKRSLTNVDWIILTGIQLAESDVDYLVDAASERRCHLRALELGECGLSVHDADVLLSTLSIHESTLEVIDISGAQGRFSPELFQQQISCFGNIRRLNLTRVQKSAGSEPLIAPETLLNWRLEELHMSQTTMNEQAVDSLSAYLASSKSNGLRELQLNQCGLTGKDLAIFFQSMARPGFNSREMHISASENRLKVGNTLLFKTIGQNYGPTHLTMRMMDFDKEHQFRELIQALTDNTSLRKLDISRASLPYDAGQETSEALKKMFSENSTLQELDISGEHAHLDTARFGIGLNLALRGLKGNKSLKVLKIEHQALGLQGADTLAELLEENTSLLEIHCDNNEISLQSFTVLVNALKNNRKIWYMPDLDADREKSLDKLRREFRGKSQNDGPSSPSKSGTIKRSFTGGFAHRTHRLSLRQSSTNPSVVSYSDQEVTAALAALNKKWEAQVMRMHKYLARNYNIANGLPWDEDIDLEERPMTTESLATAIARVQVDDESPPERASLDFVDEKMGERRPLVGFTLPED